LLNPANPQQLTTAESRKARAIKRARSEKAHAAKVAALKAACQPLGVRLMTKAEIMAVTNVSFPTIWKWMRAGKFPRARMIGAAKGHNKSVWLSTEIEAWLIGLKVRPLKGDPPAGEKIKETKST
jgi:predicted DNA-binding transcriptional regulator AlpA